MTTITSLTLENEMDLVLAYKKSILVAEVCRHTLATQTTFATSVSEIARSMIDKTNTGQLFFIIQPTKDGKFILQAKLTCDLTTEFYPSDLGFIYAAKLVPEAIFGEDGPCKVITLKIKIPASSRMDHARIKELVAHFKNLPPQTPYEEVKNRNQELYLQSIEKEEILQHSLYVVQKKDEFIAMAGHELKTPLTLIKAYSELANQLGDTEILEVGRPYIEKISIQANKMQNLIQQLLDVSNITVGFYNYRKEKVDFQEFLKSIYENANHLLPNHNIVLEMEANIPEVSIDTLRMDQVLNNLLGNAGKYSANGSLIKLSCRLCEEGIKVMVADEGIGMEENQLGKIFDKFYRINRDIQNQTSLGMGLFISSNILKAHDATLLVESEQGKGSVFYFVLPFEQ
jgi:signal transduction histidine kinase